MTRFRLAAAPLAAALLLPAAAAAKGPSSASISGPGLGKTLTIGGNGESMGTALGNITQLTGFFPAAYGQSPDPMLSTAPTKNLGPKYRIHYRVPGPHNATFSINQNLYPYAHGGALTYMKPGQRIFGMTTRGGWFLGGAPLRLALVHQGLPARATSSGASMALVAGLAVPGGLVLIAAGILGTGYRRRRQA